MRTYLSSSTSRVAAALGILLCCSPVFAQAPEGVPGRGVDSPRFADRQVIIQFRPTASDADKSQARGLANAERLRLLRANTNADLEVASLPPGMPVDVAVDILSRHPAVSFAEPNWIYNRQAEPTDAFYTFGFLWGMYGDQTSPSNPFGSQAGEAWTADEIGSDSIAVGVLDQGIDRNHPELVGNMWVNPGEVAGNGVDDDGNGYVDDVYGWDFFHDDNSVYESLNEDFHGTHVAGTIGATEGGNVVGVNWNVTMIPAKFIGPDGGFLEDVVEAIDYLIDLKSRYGLELVATNNSYGGGGYSQAFHEAIIRAAKAGILFVAAAGNGNAAGVPQNNDIIAHYPSNYSTLVGTPDVTPASYDAVIAVAAIGQNGAMYSSSNYGATTVDIGAPGVGIYSTAPDGNLLALSGTSMATPHVTGAAALYASMHPGATADEIRNAILATGVATPTASLAGKAATSGRLNIGIFITGPPTGEEDPPAAPSNLTATAISSSRIDLLWNDNSTTEIGFEVESCTGAGCTDFTSIGTVTGAGAHHINLTGDTLYRYRVRATDGFQFSDYSNIAEATTLPSEPPAAPTNLTATADSSTQITLLWSDNSSTETAFHVERCAGAGCTPVEIGTVPADNPGAVNSGLTPGTLYRYRVRAFDGSQFSSYSNIAEATTLEASPPPAALVLTATGYRTKGIPHVALSWTGATTQIDIKRNGAVIATVPASQSTFDDNLGKKAKGTFEYQVCNAGTSTCSNSVTVSF